MVKISKLIVDLMSFNSWEFFFFYLSFFPIYFFCKGKLQLFVVFIASCLFYIAAIPKYLAVLFLMISLTYFLGRLIEGSKRVWQRRVYLSISVLSSLSILFFFKYFNFGLSIYAGLLDYLNLTLNTPLFNLILPLGISFHTFQSLSYIFEVYNARQTAEKNVLVFASYVMFFPQLVAGPIERPQNMLHQFKTTKLFNRTNFVQGSWLLYWGFLKKVAIADRLATFVNPVYSNVEGNNGAILFLATIAFYFQIYFDFSGYTDMARGIARMLGIELSQNFKVPFLAKSLTEFWTRWHISLSSWFRDYLFTPLSFRMRRSGRSGLIFAVIFTFAISGLWHGANLTFLCWGIFLGCWLVGEAAWKALTKDGLNLFPPAISGNLSRLKIILVISMSYVFFRSPDLTTAELIFSKIYTSFFSANHLSIVQLLGALNSFIDIGEGFWILAPSLVGIIIFEIVNENMSLFDRFSNFTFRSKLAISWVALVVLLFSGFWFHVTNTFIYFQF